MKLYLPLLLLLATACGSKKEEPAPVPPAPAVARLGYNGTYNMAYLEMVSPTISLDLSSTAFVDWTNTLTTKEPYYSQNVFFPAGLASVTAGETLTLTLRVPRMPNPLNLNASYIATVNFAGQTKNVELTRAFLANAANYGPNGLVATVTITRP